MLKLKLNFVINKRRRIEEVFGTNTVFPLVKDFPCEIQIGPLLSPLFSLLSISGTMANDNEPAKLLLPYLQRADELQKHEPLVAYYCKFLLVFLS